MTIATKKTRTMLCVVALLSACSDDSNNCANQDGASPPPPPIDRVKEAAGLMIDEGRETFRYDTFGDEAFWSGQLRLHEGIAQVSPNAALGLGLKVDADALPAELVSQLQAGRVDLEDPATTVALLQLNAVVGVTGTVNGTTLESIGIQCALCHSTVDDSFAPGIGKRLDGWANRDLDVGAIINASPDLTPVATLLGVDEATVRAVLMSWGPGKFDAEVFLDGKAVRPGGGSAATLIPPAFGLAGVNLHTWTGWGSVTYWNAFVANLEMHGQGTFYDPRLDDATRFPIAAANGFGRISRPVGEDLITPKLAALHFYQLALEAPAPPAGSFDAAAAGRGRSSSAARPSAAAATWSRSTPSRAGTCTRRRRSASTTSRPSGRPTSVTAPRRSRACGPTRRAASTTTAASPRCSTSSGTTTSSWSSASPRARRPISSSS
jgi:hypothetical protein